MRTIFTASTVLPTGVEVTVRDTKRCAHNVDIQGRHQQIEIGSRQCKVYDPRFFPDPRIELMSSSAAIAGKSVGERTFRKTDIENSGPMHNSHFVGNSTTNPFAIAPASHGDDLKWSGPWQISRV
ncbi:hypothetical protein QA641_39835 [Bradyrhizobium sp. CB1650]|uniref:hypothetical protein n=1 Tax=Bradyrhizobium sp. CB1650 TaxID=3039153 RepID=UPI00243503C8|nr:hypothetical protein [Bradyrhizobium sp. CB1650]WGD51528.1 hypothetical protein QA641_39835 [Bradyrhizobium sp. CB1650]